MFRQMLMLLHKYSYVEPDLRHKLEIVSGLRQRNAGVVFVFNRIFLFVAVALVAIDGLNWRRGLWSENAAYVHLFLVHFAFLVVLLLILYLQWRVAKGLLASSRLEDALLWASIGAFAFVGEGALVADLQMNGQIGAHILVSCGISVVYLMNPMFSLFLNLGLTIFLVSCTLLLTKDSLVLQSQLINGILANAVAFLMALAQFRGFVASLHNKHLIEERAKVLLELQAKKDQQEKLRDLVGVAVELSDKLNSPLLVLQSIRSYLPSGSATPEKILRTWETIEKPMSESIDAINSVSERLRELRNLMPDVETTHLLVKR